MIIGRSRLSAPPPLNFSTPTRENFSNSHPPKISQPIPLPPKKKFLNPPENLSPPPPKISQPIPPLKKKISYPPRKSFTPPPLAICYLIMHIIHNMRQSPTSAALVVSCVFHVKLF